MANKVLKSFAVGDIVKLGDAPIGVGKSGDVWRCKVKGIDAEVAVKFYIVSSTTAASVIDNFNAEVEPLKLVRNI